MAEPAARVDPLPVESLREQVARLRDDLATAVPESALLRVHPLHRLGARNLQHYLALRRRDLRDLQLRLASLGLSSLGRAESHVLDNTDSVLRLLHLLDGQPAPVLPPVHPNFEEGRERLEANTAELLGPPQRGRRVRIMVTLPGEAETDLLRRLIEAGMDCVRINCAHDDRRTWMALVDGVRLAGEGAKRQVRILMDLAGPKLRTGSMAPGPSVVHWRPRRDALGRPVRPFRLLLHPPDQAHPEHHGVDARLALPGTWLSGLREGSEVSFVDARGSNRRARVKEVAGSSRVLELCQSAYVAEGTVLRAVHADGVVAETTVKGLPSRTDPILLHSGDDLVLTRDPAPGRPALVDDDGRQIAPASISCTLPDVFAMVKPGEPVRLDDGLIGGRVEEVAPDHLRLRITDVPGGIAKLRGEKGINFPASQLVLPALTAQDREDLRFAAANADAVGISFVQRPEDVEEVQGILHGAGREDLGLVLKIETQQGFRRLPELLWAAMASRAAGVMIARGDLAVECGWHRLAEVQEEILWLSEAAHLPVIWATQVLEGLAKEGIPSRAEITDAAMGERAECVMLNKGPHVVRTVATLEDILRRMEGHQSKKVPMLRQLRAWSDVTWPWSV